MDKAAEFHYFCCKMGIRQATLVFDDDETYEYLWIGDGEFQLRMVGNIPTSYIVPAFQGVLVSGDPNGC